jgi:hypothetical protein
MVTAASRKRRPLVAGAAKSQHHRKQAQHEQVMVLVSSERSTPLKESVGEHYANCG